MHAFTHTKTYVYTDKYMHTHTLGFLMRILFSTKLAQSYIPTYTDGPVV